MSKYLVNQVENYGNYLVLSLSSESNNSVFSFSPGQYVALSFKRRGKWSHVRCFSFVNTPGASELKFAMRNKGSYTRAISKLVPGTKVKVMGPYGSFTIDPSYDKKIIMLAAGIGITPFMSMLKWATESRLKNPITLIYKCNSIDDIPFQSEILRLNKYNDKLSVYFLVSNGSSDPQKGIYNKELNLDLLSSITKDNFNDYSYFICGPNTFNDNLVKLLEKEQVEEDKIVSESFTQTSKLGLGAKLNFSIPSMTYAATGLALMIGISFFTVLDLTRYVPKVQASTKSTSSNTATQASTSNASGSTNSTPSNSTATPTYSSTPQSSNNYQTYSAPVTTVS